MTNSWHNLPRLVKHSLKPYYFLCLPFLSYILPMLALLKWLIAVDSQLELKNFFKVNQCEWSSNHRLFYTKGEMFPQSSCFHYHRIPVFVVFVIKHKKLSSQAAALHTFLSQKITPKLPLCTQTQLLKLLQLWKLSRTDRAVLNGLKYFPCM